MSATNRGSERKESDFYATPLDTVYSFLNSYSEIEVSDLILEPSAGNGNIIQALRNKGYNNFIEAVELRDVEFNKLDNIADEVSICDFLTDFDTTVKYDVIIGNPPYSLAQEFIAKSLDLLAPGGRLIFLLRVNFLGSKKRFEWWKDKFPTGLYILHKRPSFTGKGTDATEYACFVWKKSRVNNKLVRNQEIKVI